MCSSTQSATPTRKSLNRCAARPDRPFRTHILADLEFPGDAVLVAIIRDGTAQPPRADAALEGEDELLFVVQPEAELELAHFLVPGVQRERVVQEDDEDPVD